MSPKGWIENHNTIEREFLFGDFRSAFEFLQEVALLAEEHHHHPDIELRYNRLKLRLSTHDAGNTITKKDLGLAEAINKLL